MSKLGARAPQTRYIGHTFDEKTASDVASGVVRTVCSFLTESGAERELEVPVIISQGEVLDPTVAMVGGTPLILSANLIEGISRAGSVYDKPQVGTIFSTLSAELHREVRDRSEYQPRQFRPMF